MATIRDLLQRNLWFLGTGTTAAIVFLVTFLAVSAATDENFVQSATILQPMPQGNASAVEEPAVVVSVAEEPEEADAEEAAVEAEPAVENDELDADASDEVVITVEEEPEPRLAEVDLPEFDEDDLIHGGDGRTGAILAGPGIVLSSGVARSTDWEILIPSARIRASIVKVGLAAGNAFGAPDNPDVIGWWEHGPQPGQQGNVLLDGHRDFRDIDDNFGTGVCWLLPQTAAGDTIIIRDNGADLHYVYEVRETFTVRWNDPDAVRFLQPTEEAILTLISCEGSFNYESRNYSSRLIVIATLMGQAAFGSADAEFGLSRG